MGKYSELWGTDNWKASEMIFVRRIGDTSSPEYTNFPVGMEMVGQVIVLLKLWLMLTK